MSVCGEYLRVPARVMRASECVLACHWQSTTKHSESTASHPHRSRGDVHARIVPGMPNALDEQLPSYT